MRLRNSIKKLLIDLGISTPDSIKSFFPRTRDRSGISVLKCQKSGVILLSRSDHVNMRHYRDRVFNERGATDRQAALQATAVDSQRRAGQFKSLILQKKWIDVGTGAGGILDALTPIAKEVVAVEPQEKSRESLIKLGYKVYPLVEDVVEKDFDVCTMFHVLEHLTEPIDTLKLVNMKLKKGGSIIVEVPHAEDFLMSFLDNDAFKKHTFWSEHLILHTRESLRIFLEAAGFTKIAIKGFQRYPLANHLHWLAKGKPDGQKVWPFLTDDTVDSAYANLLAGINKTDTLIAIAEK